jgi:hypothetical protein
VGGGAPGKRTPTQCSRNTPAPRGERATPAQTFGVVRDRDGALGNCQNRTHKRVEGATNTHTHTFSRTHKTCSARAPHPTSGCSGDARRLGHGGTACCAEAAYRPRTHRTGLHWPAGPGLSRLHNRQRPGGGGGRHTSTAHAMRSTSWCREPEARRAALHGTANQTAATQPAHARTATTQPASHVRAEQHPRPVNTASRPQQHTHPR